MVLDERMRLVVSCYTMNSLFTIDVEDWFHILDVPAAPKYESWGSLPSIVEKNTRRLLHILETHNVTATFFFVGWIAETYPHLVKEVVDGGHEAASHGYAHKLVYEMTREEFLTDAIKTRKLLEDISGERILGYRASGFSVTENVPWYFEAVLEAGYTYDSSVFPAGRGHGGISGSKRMPHKVKTETSDLTELPISVTNLFGRPMCLFGGGYFRLFPYSMIRNYGRRILTEGRPVVFYIHPREIDVNHPRLPMNLYRKFKSYVNLAGVETKLNLLFKDFSFMTCSEFVSEFTDD